jgi:hypothetical protein
VPAPKRLTDLIDYTSILPYASEMFGVYQPLLGWKSKRIERRFQQGFDRDRLQLQVSLRSQFAGVAKFAYDEGCGVEIDVQPGLLAGSSLRRFDSAVMEHLAADLPELADMGEDRWRDALNRDRVEAALKRVVPQYVEAYEAACRAVASGGGERLAMVRRRTDAESLRIGFEAQVRYESAVAGTLLHLVDEGRFDTLADLFYSSKDNAATVQMLTTLLKAGGPIEGCTTATRRPCGS